jgi:hypothetical protein
VVSVILMMTSSSMAVFHDTKDCLQESRMPQKIASATRAASGGVEVNEGVHDDGVGWHSEEDEQRTSNLSMPHSSARGRVYACSSKKNNMAKKSKRLWVERTGLMPACNRQRVRCVIRAE